MPSTDFVRGQRNPLVFMVRRMIGHGHVELHQRDQRSDESLRLAQRQLPRGDDRSFAVGLILQTNLELLTHV